MATVELLATGTAAANSADFTIALGSTACIYAKPITGATALDALTWEIQLMKKTGSDYYMVDSLNEKKPAVTITGAGTFRVRRPVATVSVGCDQET